MYKELTIEEEQNAIIDLIRWCKEEKRGKDHMLLIQEVQQARTSDLLQEYWRLLDRWAPID